MVLVLSLFVAVCTWFAYANTTHASLAGDINCEIGGILNEHNLPGLSGCAAEEETTPADTCPNDEGVQTTTPCESDDVCPDDSGIQVALPCASENSDTTPNTDTDGSNSTNETSGGGSPAVSAGGQTEPNGGGIAPGSQTASTATGGGGNGGVVLGTTTEATSTEPAAVSEIPTVNICDGQVPYLTTYLRIGQNNDALEVKKLQTFLNLHLNLSMPVTGFFGPQTFAAVNTFQLAHSDEVLLPWVPYGLSSAHTSTGYVYKTTQRMINNLACGMDLPLPQLP